MDKMIYKYTIKDKDGNKVVKEGRLIGHITHRFKRFADQSFSYFYIDKDGNIDEQFNDWGLLELDNGSVIENRIEQYFSFDSIESVLKKYTNERFDKETNQFSEGIGYSRFMNTEYYPPVKYKSIFNYLMEYSATNPKIKFKDFGIAVNHKYGNMRCKDIQYSPRNGYFINYRKRNYILVGNSSLYGDGYIQSTKTGEDYFYFKIDTKSKVKMFYGEDKIKCVEV